jgi:hypothetical protein
MNIKKSLIAGVLALGLVNLADAATVYLTGSTAMRSTVYTTLNTAGAVFDATNSISFAGRDGSSASGCNYMTFAGTIGGVATTVKCHWSGSEAGIKDVVTGQLETFLADGVSGYVSTAPTAGELDPTSRAADLAMADNSQAFSRNTSPTLTTGTKVGIITFTWLRNPSTLWSGANNVTDAQLRQALGGFAKLALFTGISTDSSYVYVSGRDNGSGTRVNALGTCGFGIFTSPNQIELDASGNMIDLDGFGTYAGDYGFSSGGTLAGRMGANTATKSDLFNGGTGFTVLTYLSRGDADSTAIPAGAIELSLNGVPQSAANVKEGKHAYWGNAYLYQKNGAGSDAVSVYNKLGNTTTGINNNCDGVKAIKLTDMHATRQGPTVDPVHN